MGAEQLTYVEGRGGERKEGEKVRRWEAWAGIEERIAGQDVRKGYEGMWGESRRRGGESCEEGKRLERDRKSSGEGRPEAWGCK